MFQQSEITADKRVERLICAALTGHPCDSPQIGAGIRERPAAYSAGWVCGNTRDYDRDCCVDLPQVAVGEDICGDIPTTDLTEYARELAECIDRGLDSVAVVTS